MNAYDFYRQGISVMADPKKVTAKGNEEARLLFEKAIELEPNYARAYAQLSYLYVREYQEGWSDDRAASLQRAEEFARKVLTISDDFDGHWHLAYVYSSQGEFAKSFLEYEAASKFRPDDPDLMADMGETLIFAGEPDKAIAVIKEAMARKIPYCYRWNLGRAYYMAKRYEEAIDAIAKLTDPPNDVRLITAASQAQLGNLDAAKAEMAEFSRNDSEWEWSIAKAAESQYRNDSDRQHWLDGLRKAGLKEK